MQNLRVISINRPNARRFVAFFFLVFLVAEWGSHSVIEASLVSTDSPYVSAHELGHGDLCKTLILCSDNGRNDQQRSGLGRDMTPHASSLNLLTILGSPIFSFNAFHTGFPSAQALHRAISPPFHPPELS
ncbi:MAG: hypothetical protein WKF34_14095 [Pyrinomonadaceae bacterium]